MKKRKGKGRRRFDKKGREGGDVKSREGKGRRRCDEKGRRRKGQCVMRREGK